MFFMEKVPTETETEKEKGPGAQLMPLNLFSLDFEEREKGETRKGKLGTYIRNKSLVKYRLMHKRLEGGKFRLRLNLLRKTKENQGEKGRGDIHN